MVNLEENTSYKQSGVVPPEIDIDSASWWQAVRAGHFMLPRCNHCDFFYFPPGPRCGACGKGELVLTDAPAGGAILSWIVVHYAQDPAFTNDVPYTVVAVEMDAGPRLFGRLFDGDPTPDRRVVAATYRVGEEILLGFGSDDASTS